MLVLVLVLVLILVLVLVLSPTSPSKQRSGDADRDGRRCEDSIEQAEQVVLWSRRREEEEEKRAAQKAAQRSYFIECNAQTTDALALVGPGVSLAARVVDAQTRACDWPAGAEMRGVGFWKFRC